MKAFKSFLKMFSASLVIFLLLASIDDYRAVIMPFFLKSGEKEVLKGDEGLKEFIRVFNERLSEMYLSSDISGISTLPADDSLKRDLAEEIVFLIRNNKTMKLKVDDVKVDEVARLSPRAVRVKTRELVTLSYHNFSDGSIVIPEQTAEYQVVYILEVRDTGWTVLTLESTGVKRIEKEEG